MDSWHVGFCYIFFPSLLDIMRYVYVHDKGDYVNVQNLSDINPVGCMSKW